MPQNKCLEKEINCFYKLLWVSVEFSTGAKVIFLDAVVLFLSFVHSRVAQCEESILLCMVEIKKAKAKTITNVVISKIILKLLLMITVYKAKVKYQ